jgi:nucleoside-diphosphate-sugar epimerase
MREVNLGDLTPTRDFTYVRDTCEALARIAESEKTVGQEINIGTNREVSIGELFESIANLMGSEATASQEWQRLRPERSEVRRLKCDNTKLRELTGFSPPTDLEQGLRLTIDWFQNPQNLCKYKAGGYVI